MSTAAASPELLSSLERHNATFESLLALIPAKHYIRQEPTDDVHDNKYMKNKKANPSAKQELKEKSKKARKDKLDPSNVLTVPEILAQSSDATGSTSRKRKAATDAAASDSDSDGAEETDAFAMDPTPGISRRPAQHRQALPPATSIAHLQAKLHARIAKLQGSRFGTGANAGHESGSKEDLLEEARIRRGELREKRRKRTREEKALEKKQGGKDDGYKKKKVEGGEKPQLSVQPGKTTLLVPEPKPEPSTSSLAFNQFTLPSSFGASSSSSTKRSAKALPTNPTQALSVLASRKEKLAELPEDVRKEKVDAARWETAVERAEGGKVRDDAGRLKKAAKKKEKEKAKSSSEWADRKEKLRSSLAVKQKKRSDNIAGKLEARKNAKKGIKPKGDKDKKAGGFKKGSGGGGGGGAKGRAGFEGKKGPGGGGGPSKR